MYFRTEKVLEITHPISDSCVGIPIQFKTWGYVPHWFMDVLYFVKPNVFHKREHYVNQQKQSINYTLPIIINILLLIRETREIRPIW